MFRSTENKVDGPRDRHGHLSKAVDGPEREVFGSAAATYMKIVPSEGKKKTNKGVKERE